MGLWKQPQHLKLRSPPGPLKARVQVKQPSAKLHSLGTASPSPLSHLWQAAFLWVCSHYPNEVQLGFRTMNLHSSGSRPWKNHTLSHWNSPPRPEIGPVVLLDAMWAHREPENGSCKACYWLRKFQFQVKWKPCPAWEARLATYFKNDWCIFLKKQHNYICKGIWHRCHLRTAVLFTQPWLDAGGAGRQSSGLGTQSGSQHATGSPPGSLQVMSIFQVFFPWWKNIFLCQPV